MQISDSLTPEDYQVIREMLDTLPNSDISLQEIWQLMDKVWDDIGCNNNDLAQEKITAFYKHACYYRKFCMDRCKFYNIKRSNNW